ncbi:hypothetical protein OF83DRAFT_1169738 [Amylostereum chailletii]|nr:hypothetical protein OF83DRAFT_1169738 [Amylostereum chailletii]
MSIPESYHVLVLHAQNWRHLHPDKVWKPLLTLDVDGQPTQMVRLGVDGQNPDRRVPMILHTARLDTTVKIGLWHKSEHKAKKKKVASATVSIGRAMEWQDKYRSFRLPLDTTTRSQRKASKTQAAPCLHLRLTLAHPTTQNPDADADASVLFSGDDTFVNPSLSGDFSQLRTPPLDPPPTRPFTALDPPPTRPFTAEPESESELFKNMPLSSSPPPRRYPRRRHTNRTSSIDTPQHLSDDDNNNNSRVPGGLPNFTLVSPSSSRLAAPAAYVAEPGSLTPLTDTETLLNTPQTSPAAMEDCVRTCGADEADEARTQAASGSVTIAAFESVGRAVRGAFEGATWYAELRDAQRAESTQMFNEVLVSLRREWYIVGGALISVVAVDATVLGFSHDNLFPVDTVAKRALIVSSIAAALGIVFDAWFLLAYGNTSGRRFQTLAIDLYSKYIFFALSSRLPLLAVVLAALALALFLLAEAWAVWPAAVAVMCGCACVLGSLQWLAYVVRGCARGARGAWGGSMAVGALFMIYLGSGLLSVVLLVAAYKLIMVAYTCIHGHWSVVTRSSRLHLELERRSVSNKHVAVLTHTEETRIDTM